MKHSKHQNSDIKYTVQVLNILKYSNNAYNQVDTASKLMLRFKTFEKAQTHTKYLQNKFELLQKDTVHAKQSQLTKGQ